MVLLGHAVDDAGFVHLTRGYQTDHLAEVSLEFVWCLQPHCPASTLDWDAAATTASCLADVYNLGGFLTRKKPTPNVTLAEEYYHTALAHDPLHCPTLGYLAELYLQMNNATAAAATALTLCAACGGADATPVRQARAEFEAAGVAWPAHGACAPAPLDSSAAALAAATTTVTVGSAPNYWSAIPSTPAEYTVSVGDKLRTSE